MSTYSWKSDETIDEKARTIKKVIQVPATEQVEEFNLIQKERELSSAEEQLVSAQKRVDQLTEELAEIKTELEIK